MMGLTAIQSNSNLSVPLTHSSVGIGVLFVAAQPQTCGFFVPNVQLPIMAGWAKQLSSWPVATQVRQLRSVCLQVIGVILRQVFNLFSGVAIMLQNTHTKKLTLSVSTTKQNSLKKQLEIIGHALDIFCTESSESNRSTLKNDVLELNRMLDDLSNDLPRKASRFNVLNDTKQLIAERVTFDQAKHYPDAVIKFAGMEVIA